MHKIGFIGGGKIAQAMAKGFIKSGMLHNIDYWLRISAEFRFKPF